MTKKTVTWLGADPDDTTPGPSFNIWGDPLTGDQVKFDKGDPVLISDEEDVPPDVRRIHAVILAAAPTNRFYKVEDVVPARGRKKAEDE
jgi:hypothetical protein